MNKLQAVGLHGRSQTGEVFRTRLEKLVQSTSDGFVWDFPDAPISIETHDREQVKSWYEGPVVGITWDSIPKFATPPQVLVGFSQGGLIAVAAALRFESVRLVIVAGAPLDAGNWLDEFFKRAPNRRLDVYFLAGEEDEVVPKAVMRQLHDRVQANTASSCGDGEVTLHWEEFPGKHQFPNNAKYVQRLSGLMATQQDVVGDLLSAQMQQDEIEVLKSIYGEDADSLLEVLRPAPQTVGDFGFQVAIQVSPQVLLKCTPKHGYPAEGGALGLYIQTTTAKPASASWIKHVGDAESALRGEASVFACVSALQEAMLIKEDEGVDDDGGEEKEAEETEQELYSRVEQCTKLARERLKIFTLDEEDDTRRGEWKLCIGLLGKPSAGKSSFFNCCTLHTTQLGLAKINQAQVGAQPFTTIDPHFGLATCQYDADFQCTVAIKDVAGLVPGAYRGLGKGNRFLNDLLDASALLHVCDGSGSSDDGGNVAVLELNPAQVSRDALWVLREVHLWIYGNVSNKWPASRKKKTAVGGEQVATRVCQLFAGYHAPPGMVTRAAKLAGLNLELASEFTRQDRHLLVAAFVAVRFPVVLALNKFDEVSKDAVRAGEIYSAAVKLMGGSNDLVVQVSAKLEMQRLETGLLLCEGGTATTGVETALIKCIQAARPVVVIAVVGTNRHRFFFYPNSQVYDLYQTLSRKRLVLGDFVRAEHVQGSLLLRALPRDAYLKDYAEVKIITNKRV